MPTQTISWKAKVYSEDGRYFVKIMISLVCPFCGQEKEFNCRPYYIFHAELTAYRLAQSVENILRETTKCLTCHKDFSVDVNEASIILSKIRKEVTAEWIEEEIEAKRH